MATEYNYENNFGRGGKKMHIVIKKTKKFRKNKK